MGTMGARRLNERIKGTKTGNAVLVWLGAYHPHRPARRVGGGDADLAMLRHVLGLLALLPHGGTMVGPRVHIARPSAAATRSTGVSCAAAPKAGRAAAPPKAGSDRKARKAKARAQQMKTMDAKLEGDASFFWQCVARHQSGGVISGISGLVPVKRDAAYLFGQAARSAQPAQLPTRLPV